MAMSDASAPWDPEFGAVALAVLGVSGVIALAGLAEGDASGVRAVPVVAFALGVMWLGERAVSSLMGGSDE